MEMIPRTSWKVFHLFGRDCHRVRTSSGANTRYVSFRMSRGKPIIHNSGISNYNNCLYPEELAKTIATNISADGISKSAYYTNMNDPIDVYKFKMNGLEFYIDIRAFDKCSDAKLNQVTELPEDIIYYNGTLDVNVSKNLDSFCDCVNKYCKLLRAKQIDDKIILVEKSSDIELCSFTYIVEDNYKKVLCENKIDYSSAKIRTVDELEEWIGEFHYFLEQKKPFFAEDLNLVIITY